MPAASGLAVAVARALLEVVTAADEVEGVAGRGRIGTELEPDKGMLAEEEAFDEEACDDPAEDAAAVVLVAVEAAADVVATRDEDDGEYDESRRELMGLRRRKMSCYLSRRSLVDC